MQGRRREVECPEGAAGRRRMWGIPRILFPFFFFFVLSEVLAAICMKEYDIYLYYSRYVRMK